MKFKTYFFRFLRTVVPQIPAIVAYIGGVKPEWVSFFVLVGGILTAIDKYCRDKKWY